MLFTQLNFAQKTDIVFLQNGDRLTGEIKQLEFGKLSLSTDDAGTIYIQWDKIKSLITDKIFEVELTDGRLYYGSIDSTDNEEQLLIKGVRENIKLFKRFIVSLTHIRQTFWQILKGDVNFGISFTKASGVGQLVIGTRANYTTRRFLTELDLNSVITTTENKPVSRKQDISITQKGFMKYRWFWLARLGAEENTQLGLQLRTSLGGGFGNNLIQSNQDLLYAIGGVLVNREWFVDSTAAKDNLEAIVGGSYLKFLYDHPKINLETKLNIWPSLSNLGRVRMQFNTDLNWEIIIDLYWVLSFYFNFDNKPQSTSASQSDYRIDTSFKYEFN